MILAAKASNFYHGPAFTTVGHTQSKAGPIIAVFCSGPVVTIFILLLKTFSLRLHRSGFFCFSGCRSSRHFHAVMLSYCHCSTGSNSHTVVLFKPSSYSPALFSVPVKIREHAYQYFMVMSRYGESTAVVQLQYVSGCGKSMIVVWRKYAGSNAYVRFKYSQVR